MGYRKGFLFFISGVAQSAKSVSYNPDWSLVVKRDGKREYGRLIKPEPFVQKNN
jgi:hypothetical protein